MTLPQAYSRTYSQGQCPFKEAVQLNYESKAGFFFSFSEISDIQVATNFIMGHNMGQFRKWTEMVHGG